MILKKSGFTLIETILVMVILAFVMSGAISLAATVVFTTEKNKNRVIATTLTQECAELIRNVRDTSWKRNLSWNCAWDSQAAPFTIEAESGAQLCGNTFHVATGSGTGDLFLEGDHYTHASGATTPFSRTIEITSSTEEEVTFLCKTTWENRGGNQERVLISTTLTNWK